MKKLFALLLVMVMGASCAVAEDAPEPVEIQFRGIPWLCSVNDAVAKLTSDVGADGFILDDQTMYALPPDEYDTYCDKGGCEYDMSWLGNTLFVAGHSVKMITLYALYYHTDDAVITNLDRTRFYKATYYIDNQEGQAVFDDLREKLTDLYGEPAETTDDDEITWYGVNDTCVVLSDTVAFVCITYGRSDADEMLEALNTAYKNMNAKSTPSDYDGL